MTDTKRIGKFKIEIDAAVLHIIAMLLMLSDHMWGTIAGNYRFFTTIGRVAYPIFAFMIAEGIYHTSNIKKYMLRLWIFALISEIPFDFMMAGKWFSIYHQNVLWTFLLAVLLILLIKSVKKLLEKITGHIKNTIVSAIVFWLLYLGIVYIICFAGFIIGTFTMVDYYGAGVVTVIVFYVFHDRKWWNFLIQLILLYYINAELLGGMTFRFSAGGYDIEFCEQALAVLALIPIWLYKGKQGYHAKWFKYFCYSFYALHMIILVLIRAMM